MIVCLVEISMFTEFTANPEYNIATRSEVPCYVLNSATCHPIGLPTQARRRSRVRQSDQSVPARNMIGVSHTISLVIVYRAS